MSEVKNEGLEVVAIVHPKSIYARKVMDSGVELCRHSEALSALAVRDARIAELHADVSGHRERAGVDADDLRMLRAELAASREQVPVVSDYCRSMLRAVLKDIRDEIPRGGLPQSWNDIAEAISETLRHPIYATPAPAVVMPERKPAGIRYPCRMWDGPDAESPEFARGHNTALDYVRRLNAVQTEVKS